LLTPAGQQLLTYALASIEPIAGEAIRKVPGDQVSSMLQVLGDLAGINLSNQ
jgi:hypothetical protein